MSKTRIYQVINNRMQFKCMHCGAKKNCTVPPQLRRKNIRCHKCGEVSKCMLNRRTRTRELQRGKAILITNEGRELDINLCDISDNGIGFDVPVGIARTRLISTGQQVRFRCSWNPRLLGNGRFRICNIKGQRIGAEKFT